MERGEILKRGFRVMPGKDGSFVVRTDDYHTGTTEAVWGLNDIDSLIKWLSEQAHGFRSEKSCQSGET